jgi:hypothetical protein
VESAPRDGRIALVDEQVALLAHFPSGRDTTLCECPTAFAARSLVAATPHGRKGDANSAMRQGISG